MEAGQARLIARRRDAIGSGFKKVQVNPTYGIRFINQYPGGPETIVQTVSPLLERGSKTGVEDDGGLLSGVNEQGVHIAFNPVNTTGVSAHSSADETLFVACSQALDGEFPPQRRPVVSNDFAIDQLDRKPTPGVPGALPGIVFVDARCDIFRDPGIQTLIRTPDYVDVPLRHGSKIS